MHEVRAIGDFVRSSEVEPFVKRGRLRSARPKAKKPEGSGGKLDCAPTQHGPYSLTTALRKDIEVPETRSAWVVHVWISHETADTDQATIQKGPEECLAWTRECVRACRPLGHDAPHEPIPLCFGRHEKCTHEIRRQVPKRNRIAQLPRPPTIPV